MTRAARRTLLLAVVLYQAVFWIGILLPFDFAWPHYGWRTAAEGDEQYTLRYWLAAVGHLSFFIPMGVLCARAPRGRNRWLTVGATVLLGVVSELSQVFVSRGPSASDFAVDMLGTVIGFRAVGRYGASRGFRRLVDALFSPPAVGVTLVVLGTAFVITTGAGTVDLSRWSPRFPLLLGNETTQDRAWQGDLYGVAIFDRVLGSDEVASLSSGAQGGRVLPLRPAVYYALDEQRMDASGVWLLDDMASGDGPLPLAVRPAGKRLEVTEDGGVRFDGQAFASSRTAAHHLTRRVRSSNALTLAVQLRAADLSAVGPTRIVSLSSGVSQRNLMLGQDGRSLRFRVCNTATNENGVAPHLVSRNLLDGERPRMIVATSDRRGSWLYVDGVLEGSVLFSWFSRLEVAVFGSLRAPTVRSAVRFITWLVLMLAFGLLLRHRLGYGLRLELTAVVLATTVAALLHAWRSWLHLPGS